MLGIDKSKSEERAELLFLEYRKKMNSGDINGGIKILKTGIKDFPSNFELLTELMTALYHSKTDNSEIVAIGERVLSSCTNDNLRIKAKNILFKIMLEKEEKEKAQCIIDILPSVRDTKEWAQVLWSDTLYTENERVMFSKENIVEWTYNLSSFMTRTIKNIDTLCSPVTDNMQKEDIENAISCYKTVIELFKLVFPNGDYGFYNKELCYMSGRIGVHYSQIGDTDNSLEYLNKCADFAKSFDDLPEKFVYTSPLIKGLTCDMTKIYKLNVESMYEEARRNYFLNERVPDELKNNAEWKSILEKISNYVIGL